MNIGNNIQKARKSLGWSLRDLAIQMGYTNHSTIARIESGTVDIPCSKLIKFAEILGVTTDYLLGDCFEENDTNTPHEALSFGSFEDTTSNKNIGARIKAIRAEQNMSVDELAKIVCKDRATIYRYENGDIENLSVNTLKLISNALNVSVSYLIDASPQTANIHQQDTPSVNLAYNLKKLFESSNLSYQELEEKTGIKKSTLQRYASGTTYKIPIQAIEKIATAFNIPMASITDAHSESNTQSTDCKNDSLLGILVRLHSDPEFLDTVSTLNSMEQNKFDVIKLLLETLT